jgi:hypothetical protein
LRTAAERRDRWADGMQRTISSAQTFLMKVVFPVVWIGGFAIGTMAMFLGAEGMHDRARHPAPFEMKWVFLLATAAGSAFIYWCCIRLKRVSVDESSLVISNYLENVVVPLREIEEVTENRWINIHPVTLHFRHETAFGRSVVFMPTVRWFGFLSSHPVVEELRTAAALAAKHDP